MTRTAVLNVVGLTRSLLEQMPRLRDFASRRSVRAIRPVLPALTCPAQATYLTGAPPAGHGIVGNGWYHRELAEVQFWKQSNHLVQGRKLWEELRELRPGFTCAKLFWWYNMYSSADYSITPRPMYPADGRKVFDVYTSPFSIRQEIKRDLGDFPFPAFWGPAAGIASSQWIARSARWIEQRYRPDLSLVYLPHLDYNLQRLGPLDPAIASDLAAIDAVAGDLISFFEERGVEPVVLSEYGITPVSRAVHLNRRFRERGWVAIKDELGLEMIDCGASTAFAVADHQVAHVYVTNPALLPAVREVVESEPGVERVLGEAEKQALGLNHLRSGDLIAVADRDSWFTYYYWLDDAVAPDFARTVDIHRKIGYDPAELFLDPDIRLPKARVAKFLLKKKLGFRALLDVIPLKPELVQGSHGRIPESSDDWPVLIAPADAAPAAPGVPATAPDLAATDVYPVLRQVCTQ